jgi:hypothetical protein
VRNETTQSCADRLEVPRRSAANIEIRLQPIPQTNRKAAAKTTTPAPDMRRRTTNERVQLLEQSITMPFSLVYQFVSIEQENLEKFLID